MRSNAGSVEISRRSIMRETSSTLDAIDLAQSGLDRFNLKEHDQQADMSLGRQTRDWVKSRCSSSVGRGNIAERQDVIDKQLRAANVLAGELARIKTGEQKSKSVKGLKSKAECQDLQFVGGWMDEKD
jgi:hypothetical protein